MEEKIYKPKSCEDCPCYRQDKKGCFCGSEPRLKADKGNYEQLKEMWNRCPIDWDK